jgi:hypothetical protein
MLTPHLRKEAGIELGRWIKLVHIPSLNLFFCVLDLYFFYISIKEKVLYSVTENPLKLIN